MIVDIKQEMLIYKSVFEIIALFVKLPSLDQYPCYLSEPRMDSLFLVRHPQHCTNESSSVVGRPTTEGFAAEVVA